MGLTSGVDSWGLGFRVLGVGIQGLFFEQGGGGGARAEKGCHKSSHVPVRVPQGFETGSCKGGSSTVA